MKKLNILCIVLLSAGIAIAGPYDPDYRGQENSVHAIFLGQPYPPSGLPPPPAPPVLFETGPWGYPLDQTPPEIFHDGISQVITLPNFIDDLPTKKMRIQMFFSEPIFGTDIFIDVAGLDPEPVNWVVTTDISETLDLIHYIDIEMRPNPDAEIIWISTPNLAVDLIEIEVDTISIPEPASLGLIGLFTGGIFFVRRFFAA